MAASPSKLRLKGSRRRRAPPMPRLVGDGAGDDGADGAADECCEGEECCEAEAEAAEECEDERPICGRSVDGGAVATPGGEWRPGRTLPLADRLRVIPGAPASSAAP